MTPMGEESHGWDTDGNGITAAKFPALTRMKKRGEGEPRIGHGWERMTRMKREGGEQETMKDRKPGKDEEGKQSSKYSRCE